MSILFETISFINSVESQKDSLDKDYFAENAYEIFNKLLQIDTQSAMEFNDWVKSIINA